MLGFRARLKSPEFWLDVALVGLLGGAGLFFRTMLWQNRMRLPAGDTFNFINAAAELAHLTYPPLEKRPPFMPLMVLIANHIVPDPINAVALVTIISGVVGIILLYFIGRSFEVPRLIMAGFAVIALFDPLLALYGVRPLSQGLFFALLTLVVLLAIYSKPTKWYTVSLGASLIALALTRQEGIVIALAVWVLLFLKLPWKNVLLICLTSLLLFVPWLLIAAKSTGVLFQFPGQSEYVEEFTSGERGTTDPKVVFDGIVDISIDNWAIPWNSPVLIPPEDEEDLNNESAASFVLGMLAIVGLGWMTIKQPKNMAIFFAAFGLVVLIAAWYRASGKYASPYVSTWYVAGAAGLAALIHIARQLIPQVKRFIPVVSYIIALLLVGNIAPATAVSGTSYIVSDMGMNWAQLQAMRYVWGLDEKALVTGNMLSARSYMGRVDVPGDEKHNALLFKGIEDLDVDEQRDLMVQYDITYYMEDGSDASQKLTRELNKRGELAFDSLFVSYLKGEEEGQLIRVFQFSPE